MRDRGMRRLDFPPWVIHERRSGAGTPVALVHGLAGSSRWWERNVDAIAERHLVAAVDLVGFGRSRRFFGWPEVLPPFGEATALLGRWLEAFGEPVHLVGHSMGGQLAIGLAASRPDLVRSLVLVNAAGIPFEIHPLDHLKVLPKPPFGGPRIARVLLPDFLRAGPASVAVASARVLRGDMRDAMHHISSPALLVWGENDPLVPLRYAHAMQSEIAGSRLVVLPRAAHVAMWDAPEEFNRVVLSFFDDVESGAVSGVASRSSQPSRGTFTWAVSGWTEGIAHRQAGRARDVVLVHGLGMSSAYFEPLARSLFDAGFSPVAADLPGFGESSNAAASAPAGHANALADWADALGIGRALWIGHSSGCNAVALLARVRPDLVSAAVHIGPLWTRTGWPTLRAAAMLAVDAFREPAALYRWVIAAYWRTGIARWWMTWRRLVPDLREEPPGDALFIAGASDPIPDRRRLPDLALVPGAHACVVSSPNEIVAIVRARLHR